MRKAAFISPALVVAGILAGAGLPPCVMPSAAVRAQAASPAAANDFTTFLARVGAAQLDCRTAVRPPSKRSGRRPTR